MAGSLMEYGNLDDLSTAEMNRARRQFVNKLMFETPGGIRYTQDSPILPNVWTAFAREPRKQQELILTISQNGGTGKAALELRNMLKQLRDKRPFIGRENSDVPRIQRKRARISYIPGQIAVKLYFDELMRVVLPLTPWWHLTYDRLRSLERTYGKAAKTADWIPFPQPDKKRQKDITDALMLMRQDIEAGTIGDHTVDSDLDKIRPTGARLDYVRDIPPDFIWFVRIAGLISDCFGKGHPMLSGGDSLGRRLFDEFKVRDLEREGDEIETSAERTERIKEVAVRISQVHRTRVDLAAAFTNLYKKWSKGSYPDDRLIWRVTKNRPVSLAVAKSVLTVKADAAKRLFDVSCKNITWAVLDSGIDSAHPAFKNTSPEHEAKVRRDLGRKHGNGNSEEILPVSELGNRIVKTLDFTKLRELLDYDIDESCDDPEIKERKLQLEVELARRLKSDDEDTHSDNDTISVDSILTNLRNRIRDGKDISWQDLEHAIVDNNPQTPINDHGTHVAGILAADWIEDDKNERNLPLAIRRRKMQGVCPDINLIDVRVFRDDGLTDEFELLAAVQFLRWMNSRAGTMQVHGANLSLSLVHDVHKFACGQTPICDECNEASALGMVMVAAAGNRGFEMGQAEKVQASDGYRAVSITDPGNAHSVITVGATHRKRPHEYGVSYFSSRGPTGDGRLKPDLVAPGEKIRGPTPNGRSEFKDGTSMAAPHVSGVAAMLMARHSELIAQPDRIKSILCDTATDLEREKYFQGHGLVDALRALQSV